MYAESSAELGQNVVTKHSLHSGNLTGVVFRRFRGIESNADAENRFEKLKSNATIRRVKLARLCVVIGRDPGKLQQAASGKHSLACRHPFDIRFCVPCVGQFLQANLTEHEGILCEADIKRFSLGIGQCIGPECLSEHRICLAHDLLQPSYL